MRKITACAALLALSSAAAAQDFDKLQPPAVPLTLSDRGSFFVGGETVEQSFVELGSARAADSVTVNQMYVEYMVPSDATGVPWVMVHGAGLSGKTYDTTPDGRMGWYEYFVRQGHPTYVVDQVGRARSGFNQAVFNNVGAGELPPGDQPRITRMGDRIAVWTNFRIGPDPDSAYPDTKFPVDAIKAFSRQGIPDLYSTLPSPNPSYAALATLSQELRGAVIMGHSQSGHFPLQAALSDGANVNAAVLVEPGYCGSSGFSDDQIATLAEIPVLIVYGDHLDTPTGLSGPGWPERFEDCNLLLDRLRTAGGSAGMMFLPDQGINGNTHMLMMDLNNQEIADLILNWVQERTAETR